MLGAPGVGKTSLVRRYVHSVFSEDYHSTLGVKVDRKTVALPDAVVNMLVWDVHGEGDGLTVPAGYLTGASAALFVFDSTRQETIGVAGELRDRLLEVSPNALLVPVANKSDLEVDWPTLASAIGAGGFSSPVRSSAKTGEGVDEAFLSVAEHLVAKLAN